MSCSQVLQTVDLDIDSEDISIQDKFDVVAKTLTFKEATAQKCELSEDGIGKWERKTPNYSQLALKSKFPVSKELTGYKIGIGDTIKFSKLVENNRSDGELASNWPGSKHKSNYKLELVTH